MILKTKPLHAKFLSIFATVCPYPQKKREERVDGIHHPSHTASQLMLKKSSLQLAY
jgi:hypothetical protein